MGYSACSPNGNPAVLTGGAEVNKTMDNDEPHTGPNASTNRLIAQPRFERTTLSSVTWARLWLR